MSSAPVPESGTKSNQLVLFAKRYCSEGRSILSVFGTAFGTAFGLVLIAWSITFISTPDKSHAEGILPAPFLAGATTQVAQITPPPQFIPTDITPYTTSSERNSFSPGIKFRLFQALPERLWFNCTTEVSQRLDTNVFFTYSHPKPDYTFLLPQGHCINMDVKFPLDNYLQMVNAPEGVQRDSYEKEFIKNVKDRIREIQNRDYINPSENTLDFVLLFIPNEQVFGLIQEKMPDVMDFALKQKVVLCSPFTLYAMLSVVRQAHEHFRFEKDIKKIIELIEGFTKDYELFKNRFADLGSLIYKVSIQYADITDKSFKKLDGKIQRIEDHKKGHKIPSGLDAEAALPRVAKDLIDAA